MGESSHKEKPLSMFTLNLKVQPMKKINHKQYSAKTLFVHGWIQEWPHKEKKAKIIHDTNTDELE
jgi:hypothetical protein